MFRKFNEYFPNAEMFPLFQDTIRYFFKFNLETIFQFLSIKISTTFASLEIATREISARRIALEFQQQQGKDPPRFGVRAM